MEFLLRALGGPRGLGAERREGGRRGQRNSRERQAMEAPHPGRRGGRIRKLFGRDDSLHQRACQERKESRRTLNCSLRNWPSAGAIP